MKNILFILSLIIWCSCSNEILFDIDKVGDIVTRAANSDSTYCFWGFRFGGIVEDFVIGPKDDSQPLSRTLCSYVEVNGTKTLLQPEIVSDPSWLDYLICFQYYDIYVLSVVAQDNTSSLRSGKIVLKQPGSNKTLTVGITQNGIDNRIMISMKELYSNHFANAKIYFQSIVDKIRSHCRNIIWVPGLAYQSQYAGYATHRIEGDNIGFAVHCYPGWYGSDAEKDSGEGIGSSTGGGYESFQRGWDKQVGPVAAIAPIMVTEIDWAPLKYDATWGKSITGEAGGKGFGANFKYIADNAGNVSWLFFTTRSHELAAFKDVPGTEGNYTFLNDPEACPWAMYHWFKEYAEGVTVNGEPERLELMGEQATRSLQMGGVHYLKVKAVYKDGTSRMVTAEATINSSDEQVLKVEPTGKLVAVAPGNATVTVTYRTAAGNSMQQTLQVTVVSPFVLTEDVFDPSIWEEGTFDETTRTLVTGKYGFGGWKYPGGLDLSGYRRLTVELGNDNECGVSFRLFDKNDYWTKPATYDFGQTRRVVVDLQQMKDTDGNRVDPSHLYIVGFWSTGGKPIVISSMKLE